MLLCLLAENWRCISACGLLLLHLAVECLPLLEYLHQFVVDLITIELFEDLLLMLELVLRLASLLSLLLLLDQSIGIFRLVGAGIAGL